MSLTNCRFYEEKYPEIDSFVMVNVKQVGGANQEMGLSCRSASYGTHGSDRFVL